MRKGESVDAMDGELDEEDRKALAAEGITERKYGNGQQDDEALDAQSDEELDAQSDEPMAMEPAEKVEMPQGKMDYEDIFEIGGARLSAVRDAAVLAARLADKSLKQFAEKENKDLFGKNGKTEKKINKGKDKIKQAKEDASLKIAAYKTELQAALKEVNQKIKGAEDTLVTQAEWTTKMSAWTNSLNAAKDAVNIPY